MNRTIIFAIASALLGITLTASAAEMTLVRNSRPVTADEAAGGAPWDGMVHDFYATSDADLLSLGPEISVSVYKHRYVSTYEAPAPELVAMYPAAGASSYFQLPGSTIVLGGGFTVPGSAWGDLSNDGPQSNFHFGRLTTSQSGMFAGNFYVRGDGMPITLPFSLSLPGPNDEPLSEQVSVVAAPILPDPVTPPQDPAPGPNVNQAMYSEKSLPGVPVSVTLTRRTRPVSSADMTEGAPEGYVHEFFVTSSTDVIDIRDVALDVRVYERKISMDKHELTLSNINAIRSPRVVADSFIDTPDRTVAEGSFATAVSDSSAIWYDRFDSGPQEEFLFARLTLGETGHFSGAVSVAGPEGRVELPFNFVLPGTAKDLALIDQEPKFSFAYLPEPAAVSRVPEPSGMLMAALIGLVATMLRPRPRAAIILH